MARGHGRKLRLCTMLEEVADSLPGRIDRLKCLHLASELVPLLRSIHDFEETAVFPLFRCAARCDLASGCSIRRLKSEHIEDEAYADELSEVLMHAGHGQAICNPDAFGFMLRGFFTTLRRHVAFEQSFFLPSLARCDWSKSQGPDV